MLRFFRRKTHDEVADSVREIMPDAAKLESEAVKRLARYARSLETRLRESNEKSAALSLEIESMRREADERDNQIDRLERQLALAKIENESLSGIVSRDRARVDAETARYTRLAAGEDLRNPPGEPWAGEA